MDQYQSIDDFFSQIFKDLNCGRMTRAYITSVFSKYKRSNCDLSDQSLTILYMNASGKKDFATYQNIGDWIFFHKSIDSTHLNHASQDYYNTLAQMSYYGCYKITNRQIKYYEEMADRFVSITKEAKEKLKISITL